MDTPFDPRWSFRDRLRIARGWALCRVGIGSAPLYLSFGLTGILAALAGVAWYGAVHLPTTIVRALHGS